MKRHTVDDLLARLEAQRTRPASERSRKENGVNAPAVATDFAIEEQRERRRSRMNQPTTWQSPVLPQPRSWMGQQVRSGLIGLVLGSSVLVPTAVWLKGKHRTTDLPAIADSQTSGTSAPVRTASVVAPSVTTSEPATIVEATPRLIAPPRPLVRAEPVAPVVPVVPVMPTTEPVRVAAVQTETPALAAAPKAEPQPQSRPIGEVLLEDARRLVDDGDILGARTILTKAELERMPQARFLLAETYDPNLLAAWGARDVTAEADRARMLYEQALNDGVTAAAQRIKALEVR